MSVGENRAGYGADILKDMWAAEELPLPHVRAVAKVMQRYWKEGGYENELKEEGKLWRPDVDYWIYKMSDIQRALRQEHMFFEFDREWGEFKGKWRFMTKPEYVRKMRRDAGGLATRVEHYNEKLEDGQQRWQIQLPTFDEPPLLPPPIH